MFGRSKPVVLESYGHRRKRGRPPRWLVLLLSGVAVGVAGVLVVQQRYLPPRLSASESSKLRAAYDSTEAERQRLQQALGDTERRLAATTSQNKALQDELAGSRTRIERLSQDLATTVEALPPDPRGGTVEVRAGKFTVRGGALVYDVVLARDRASNKPTTGVMQLQVVGSSAKSPQTTVALKPVPVSFTSHEVVSGSQPLPEGFKAREATIQVLDRPAGRALGMRVMLVK
ncbi:MAG: hypothetical protein KF892_02885 [Rhizobacter sp.]|nr:hypothetical protein [Rhizobacter sp.]